MAGASGSGAFTAPGFRPPRRLPPPFIGSLASAKAERARRHLRHFFRWAWPLTNPGEDLHGVLWHLDAIAEHLEAIHRQQIQKLIINIPPRSLKSTTVSVDFPAWEWIHDPSLQYLTSSYRLDLAIRDAVHSRRLMQSPEYQAMIPRDEDGDLMWRFTTDQNVKSRYENDKGGHRICTAPDAGATGEGGLRVMVDDPHNVKQIESDTIRQAQIDWWNKTMSSRLNDQKRGARIVIMQRIHERDLTGDLLEKGGWEHLCLPTICEKKHPYLSKTSLHFVDPRAEGELLCPEHFDQAAVAEARIAQGSYGFDGQHQQRPRPAEGGIFKEEWFRLWDETTVPPTWDRVIQSWDLSFKGDDNRTTHAAEVQRVADPSYVHGSVWGIKGANVYLLDERHRQADFFQAILLILGLSEAWPEATRKLYEDKANGPAMQSMLTDKIVGLIPVEPQGSKVQRARACQPIVEAGNVFVPDPRMYPWARRWLDEVCGFPFAKHNDRVDTLTQMLIHEQISEAAAAARRARNLVKL